MLVLVLCTCYISDAQQMNTFILKIKDSVFERIEKLGIFKKKKGDIRRGNQKNSMNCDREWEPQYKTLMIS